LALLSQNLISQNKNYKYYISTPSNYGKISGIVKDFESKEPIIGVNVFDSSHTYGTTTDIEGEFVLLNVVPGYYTFYTSLAGYKKIAINNVKVEADSTTRLDFFMRSCDFCEEDSLEAMQDILKGTMKDRIAGLIFYDPLYDDRANAIAAKYGLTRIFTGCVDMCSETYNRVIARHLEKIYGEDWQEEYYSELREAWEDRKSAQPLEIGITASHLWTNNKELQNPIGFGAYISKNFSDFLSLKFSYEYIYNERNYYGTLSSWMELNSTWESIQTYADANLWKLSLAFIPYH